MTIPQLTEILRRSTAFVQFTRGVSAFGFFLYGLINRLVPCKTRYIFTSSNRLRLRYIVSACVVLIALGVLSARSAVRLDYMADGASDEDVAYIDPSAGAAEDLDVYRDGDGQIRRDAQAKEAAALVKTDDRATKETAALKAPVDVSVEVGKGDTFAGVLVDAGVDAGEAHSLVAEVSEHFNMKKLHAGQKLDLRLEPDSDGSTSVSKVSFAIDPLKTLHVERKGNGELNSRLIEKPVQEQRRAARVVIDGSLYGSAEKANLPDTITANAIKMFSYAVDFQRDIKQGDKLEVLYNSSETKDGYIAKTGDIIHARMVIGGREFSLYQYKNKDGSLDYFTQDGKSVRKSGSGLMKTPIAFGRMSSGFGMREHPILGYTKMHKGVDFAAPRGTAVYAAADGKIEKEGPFSSYGNYIRIRHNSKMSTAYAHLQRFAPGVMPGGRVRQGQVIAYVGTTGRSTGPHLHFEVLVNNVQVNPTSVKMMAEDKSLKGEDLKRFKAQVRGMDQEYVRQTSATRMASAKGVNAGNLE